jgi:hypothetical protein
LFFSYGKFVVMESIRRQRALLPTLELLDGRRLPSAVQFIAPAVVAPDSPRSARLEAEETADPGHPRATRPHVPTGPVLPLAPREGSKPPSAEGSSDDDGGTSASNDSDEPTDRPGGLAEKNGVEVELAASSNGSGPQPRPWAHHLHAPSLLADKPTGRRKTGYNSGLLIGPAREATATIPPAPRGTATTENREPAAATTHPASSDWYGVGRGSDLIDRERPTTAAIATRSQPADKPGPYLTVTGPDEVAPHAWATVLGWLACGPAPTDPPGAREMKKLPRVRPTEFGRQPFPDHFPNGRFSQTEGSDPVQGNSPRTVGESAVSPGIPRPAPPPPCSSQEPPRIHPESSPSSDSFLRSHPITRKTRRRRLCLPHRVPGFTMAGCRP